MPCAQRARHTKIENALSKIKKQTSAMKYTEFYQELDKNKDNAPVLDYLIKNQMHKCDPIGSHDKHHLREAALQGDVLITAALLRNGVDVNEVSGDVKRTAILTAANCNEIEICRLLVAHGADLSICDVGGANVFHLAATNGECYNVIKLFLESGANWVNAENPNGIKNNSGRTALDIYRICSNQSKEVCKLLEDARAKFIEGLKPKVTVPDVSVQTVEQQNATSTDAELLADVLKRAWKRLDKGERYDVIGEIPPEKFVLLSKTLGADF
jgi:ankyrin repeat protein